jgi:hypothetical protein
MSVINLAELKLSSRNSIIFISFLNKKNEICLIYRSK